MRLTGRALEQFQREVVTAWQTRLAAADINAPPATEAELRAFEAEFGPIPPEFRWFLAVCGGGPVGSEGVDNIRDLPETTGSSGPARNLGWL